MRNLFSIIILLWNRHHSNKLNLLHVLSQTTLLRSLHLLQIRRAPLIYLDLEQQFKTLKVKNQASPNLGLKLKIQHAKTLASSNSRSRCKPQYVKSSKVFIKSNYHKKEQTIFVLTKIKFTSNYLQNKLNKFNCTYI